MCAHGTLSHSRTLQNLNHALLPLLFFISIATTVPLYLSPCSRSLDHVLWCAVTLGTATARQLLFPFIIYSYRLNLIITAICYDYCKLSIFSHLAGVTSMSLGLTFLKEVV